ncbi:MAG: hypothetical protein OEY50_07785, partial [Nitrospinota bacterium]|nr:hypothetical protein [Nitrospinota bacterium]
MNLDQSPTAQQQNPNLERLIKLQEVDKIIGQLTELIQEQIPRQIKALEDDFTSDLAKLKHFDEEVSLLSKQKKALEAEVEDTKVKIAKAKLKLPEVKTNVEYRAILKESDNFERRILKIEDEQLELMEKMEEKALQRPSIESQVADDKARLDKLKAEMEVELKSHSQRLKALNEERSGIIGAVEPDVLASYDKVRKQRKGVGVAQVKDGLCMACF